MPGKEYRAKARTVQKMSRDGLVEENLRTGKRRKVRVGKEGEIRIGDRPMEEYKDTSGTGLSEGSDRDLRWNRKDLAGEPEDRTHGGGMRQSDRIPYDRQDEGTGLSEPGKKNRKMSAGRESSLREAPSSLEDDGGIDGGAGSDFDSTDGAAAGSRLKNSRYSALRNERGGSPSRAMKEGADTDHKVRGDIFADEEPEAEAAGKNRLKHRMTADTQKKTGEAAGKTGESTGAEKPDPNAAIFTDKAFESAVPGDEEPAEELVSQQSKRMQGIRGHPSGTTTQAARSAAEIRHSRQKKQVYDYAAGEKRKESRLRETTEEAGGLEDAKEEILGKQKKERLNQEQRKIRGKSRLSFDDGNGMVQGSGMGYGHRKRVSIKDAAFGSVSAAAGAAGFAAHAKLSDVEDENAGTQAAHHAEMAAEDSARSLASRKVRRASRKAKATRRKAEEAGVNRLVFAKEEGTRTAKAAKIEADKKATIKRFFTKQRQRRMYAAAKKEEKTVETLIKTQQNIVTKAAVVVKEAFIRNSKVFLILGMMGVFFLLISASLTSCTALMQGAGSSVVGTTYPSTDEDIYAVENRYRELEAGLNAQINAMRAAHPEYDDFRYQIDEISHNPYHLISYFTTKYGEFTYEQVKDELEEIFREQYGLTTSGERNVTVTETKKVRVGDSLGQVVTSGYCNCSICCGQWSGGPTASGVYPTAAHTIAVDSSTPFVPMGTHVVMNGVEYVVEDTGPLSRYGVQFDVYYDDHQVAQNHGHQTWEAYLADDNGTQEIEVTTTQTVNRYSVSLTNHNLDTVLRNRLTDDEKVRYALYNRTFGHRDYLFDLNSLPTYGGNGYTIPPEALSDERFARMIAEAEKHLGTPYVWGGYAPGGFDCSGFVSWVINHCGNGWDYGRLTAEGIRQVCAYVSPEEAKPGDIIFFQKTYDTEGASHVGIYVGDGMMIHCGKPVQYTTIHTDYWNSHFLQFGRLP